MGQTLRFACAVAITACGGADPATPTPVPISSVAPPPPPGTQVRDDAPPPPAGWVDATGPAGPLTFVRQLRSQATWKFKLAVHSVIDQGSSKPSVNDAAGRIEVVSLGDGTARMVLDVTPADGSRPVRQEQIFDEAGVTKADPTGAALELLFPVPPRPMRIGDSETFPLRLPLTVQGRTQAAGQQTLTFVGHSRVHGLACARFSLKGNVELADDGSGNHGQAQLSAQYCIDPTDSMLVASVFEVETSLTMGSSKSRMYQRNQLERE